MKHPAHAAYTLETKLQSLQVLLTENKFKAQSPVKKLVSKCQETLKELRSLYDARERQKAQEQRIFCDKLTIEYSHEKDFSDSYTRSYKSMVVDMDTLKTLIYGERQLQNMSEQLLYARITITDNEPEFE